MFNVMRKGVSHHPLDNIEKKKGTERYENPELAAEHVPRSFHELESTMLMELPVPLPELLGVEQRHEADDTSIPKQGVGQN